MKKPTHVQVGDRFRVSQDCGFNKGEIIKLHYDDKTNSPSFINKDGFESYIHFENLEPLTRTLEDLREGDVLVDEDGEKVVREKGVAYA